MNPEIEAVVTKLKAAGLSDHEVAAYLSENPDLFAPEMQRSAVAAAKGPIAKLRAAGLNDDEIKQYLTEKGIVTDRRAAFSDGVAQGVSFGFDDELQGLKYQLRHPLTSGTYTAARDYARLQSGASRDAHPVIGGVGEVAGGLATAVVPIGAAATGLRAVKATPTALGVGSRILRGLKLGGMFGGVAGAGHAEGLQDVPKDVAVGAATGAAAGAVLDAAVPPILSLAGRILAPGRAAKVAASEGLAGAVNESGGPQAVRAEAERLASAGRGKEVTLGDLSDPLRAEADFVGTHSPRGREALQDIVAARRTGAAERAVGDVEAALVGEPVGPGLPIAGSRRELLQTNRRAWADRAYGELRTANPNAPRVSAQALQDPKVLKAAGLKPGASDLGFDEAHEVQANLADAVNVAFRKGRTHRATTLQAARNQFVAEMEARFPDYAKVSREYARRMSLETALADGEALGAKFATGQAPDPRMVERVLVDLRKGPQGRRPTELTTDAFDSEGYARRLDQYRYGIVSKLLEKIQSTGLNKSFASAVWSGSGSSPSSRRILRAAFENEEAFKHYLERTAAEAQLGRLSVAVGGSQTAGRLGAQAHVPSTLFDLVVGGQLKKAAAPRAVADALATRMTTPGEANVSRILREISRRTPPSSAVGSALDMGVAPVASRALWDLLGQGAQ